MNNAIEIRDLRKTYAASGKASAKEALLGIDLDIPRGSIFGLLGPNGAGKSTLINILAGLVVKTAGSVRIWESDLDRAPRQAKASIGIVPQEITFDPFFTPRRMLDIQAGLYGVPKLERRTDDLLALVGLTDKANAYARSLSGGMRRRLMVAKAMVHNPPILVLDEPSAGVDLELRTQLWQNVKALNKKGVTVLLTTHYLEEAEQLCDRIAIIHHGQIVANAEKEELIARLPGKEIRFRLDREIETVPQAFAGFDTHIEGKRTLMLRYNPEQQKMDDLIARMQQSGFGIADITTHKSDLEDVFRALTASKAK